MTNAVDPVRAGQPGQITQRTRGHASPTKKDGGRRFARTGRSVTMNDNTRRNRVWVTSFADHWLIGKNAMGFHGGRGTAARPTFAHLTFAVIAALLIDLGFSRTADASYEAGMHAFMTGRFDEALAHFEPMVKQRHSLSETALGLMYMNGMGVPKDPARAASLFARAASSGNSAAANYLGILHQAGVGVPLRLDLAFKWFRQSAEGGYPEGELNLGIMYEEGLGVSVDYEQAAAWYGRGATRGLGGALFRLALLYDTGRGVERDGAKSAVLLERASARGNAQARTALGQKYVDGDGVTADPVVAYMYLILGSSLGDKSGAPIMQELERVMTPAQLDEAHRLARNWRPA